MSKIYPPKKRRVNGEDEFDEDEFDDEEGEDKEDDDWDINI